MPDLATFNKIHRALEKAEGRLDADEMKRSWRGSTVEARFKSGDACPGGEGGIEKDHFTLTRSRSVHSVFR